MEDLRPTILVCDDESSIREAFTLVLQDDYRVLTVATGEAALKKITNDKVDLIFLDIRMPGMDGIETLAKLKGIDANIPVVMVTAVNDVQKASEATALGSYNYIVKPFNIDDMIAITRSLLGKKQLVDTARPIRERQQDHQALPQLIGQTRRMMEIREILPELAESKLPVFLVGESGTEKHVIALLFHHESGGQPATFHHHMVCREMPEKVARIALFGMERGTFATNLRREVGAIERANEGTLFLEHVDRLPAAVQRELAKVVRERRILREGSDNPIGLNVRFTFSADSGATRVLDPHFCEVAMQTVIEIPPLRERLQDVQLLTQHFLECANARFGKSLKLEDEAFLAALESYAWPGNVEELQAVIDRLVLLAEPQPVSLLSRLPISVFAKLDLARFPSDAGRFSLEELGGMLERMVLQKVLHRVEGNVSEAAELVGMKPNALRLKCDLLNIPLT